jgi:hypothetical protein
VNLGKGETPVHRHPHTTRSEAHVPSSGSWLTSQVQVPGSHPKFRFLAHIPSSGSWLTSQVQAPGSHPKFRFLAHVPSSGSWLTSQVQVPGSRPKFRFLAHVPSSGASAVASRLVANTLCLFSFSRGFKQPAVAVATVCRSVLAILRPTHADTWAECQSMMAGKIFIFLFF